MLPRAGVRNCNASSDFAGEKVMRFWLTRLIRAAALVPVLTLCVGAASLTGTLSGLTQESAR